MPTTRLGALQPCFPTTVSIEATRPLLAAFGIYWPLCLTCCRLRRELIQRLQSHFPGIKAKYVTNGQDIEPTYYQSGEAPRRPMRHRSLILPDFSLIPHQCGFSSPRSYLVGGQFVIVANPLDILMSTTSVRLVVFF